MAQSIEGFVNDAMDNAEMSGAHWRALALITAGLFFDLVDLAIFGGLVPDMVKDQFLTLGNVPFVVTGVLLGIVLRLRRAGRAHRPLRPQDGLSMELLLYGFATIACAFSPNYYWLAGLRLSPG